VIFFVVKEEFGKRVKEGIMCGEKLSAGESKNLNSWRLFLSLSWPSKVQNLSMPSLHPQWNHRRAGYCFRHVK